MSEIADRGWSRVHHLLPLVQTDLTSPMQAAIQPCDHSVKPMLNEHATAMGDDGFVLVVRGGPGGKTVGGGPAILESDGPFPVAPAGYSYSMRHCAKSSSQPSAFWYGLRVNLRTSFSRKS